MKRTFNGVLGIRVTSVLNVFICELVVLSIYPSHVPRYCAWTQTSGLPWEELRGHPAAPLSQGTTGPELVFLLPVGLLSCICPRSELAVPEAVSRHRRRLRAEPGSEARDRLKVQGQALAGRRLESEEASPEEECQPCNRRGHCFLQCEWGRGW